MRLRHLGLGGLAVAVLALAGTVGCGSGEVMMPMEATLNQKLVGTWRSSACELGIMASVTLPTSIYFQREYKFTETDWTATASIFVDQLCASSVLRSTVKGTTVGAAASTPAGGTELDFNYAERKVLLPQPLGRRSSTASCGGMSSWTAGVDVDVSTKGCLPLMPSNIACPKEFDVGKIDGDVKTSGATLTLGTRPMSPDGLCRHDRRRFRPRPGQALAAKSVHRRGKSSAKSRLFLLPCGAWLARTMTFLDELNPSQRAAVVHQTGPLLILAGAGSARPRHRLSPRRASAPRRRSRAHPGRDLHQQSRR